MLSMRLSATASSAPSLVTTRAGMRYWFEPSSPGLYTSERVSLVSGVMYWAVVIWAGRAVAANSAAKARNGRIVMVKV